MVNTTNWENVIEDNCEIIKEKMIAAYTDALNNSHMRFVVCLEPNGNIYTIEDLAGGNAIAESVWNGIDIVITDYDGCRIGDTLEDWLGGRYLYEVVMEDFMTEEDKTEFHKCCVDNEVTDELDCETVLFEKFPNIIKEVEEAAYQWTVEDYIDNQLDYEIQNTIDHYGRNDV